MGAQTTERRCGRCQQPFANDPDLTFQSDWGLCPACTEILLPRPAGRPSAVPTED
jgi:hypothetical protein